jgi:hypothetical protein
MAEALNLVRSICEAWSRGDYTSVKSAHPEIEWSFGPDGPSPELSDPRVRDHQQRAPIGAGIQVVGPTPLALRAMTYHVFRGP